MTAAAPDVRRMFDRIATRYDAANRAMSVGIDVRWRKRAIAGLLTDLGPHPRLLDLGAGTLDGAIEIARAHDGARVIAADFAQAMLAVGQRKLASAGLAPRVAPLAADACALPFASAAFDGAFSAFCLRNVPRLSVALGELRRVVRPGGRLAVLEFFRPERPRLLVDKLWNARVLPLVGWAVSGDRDAYRYLPASIDRFVGTAAFGKLLADAGFAHSTVHDFFPSGVASLVVAS